MWLPTPSDADRYLGPYRVIEKVGAGGMGIVYLGVDPTDRPVAIKVLREFIAEDLQARSRLGREVETLRRVRHRSIAAVIDADLHGEQPYLVTEFVRGPQLDVYIDDVGPLSTAGLVNLGRGLIGALGAIHEAGVVHRDLKPGNVLLQKDTPVVIDFGIAQAADDVRLTVTGLFVGTPGYVSPEVIDGRRATAATDWWGWAATMAFAATGRPPAGTGPVPVVLDRIRRGHLDTDGIEPGLRGLLVACLHPDPARRPAAPHIAREFERLATATQAHVAVGGGVFASARSALRPVSTPLVAAAVSPAPRLPTRLSPRPAEPTVATAPPVAPRGTPLDSLKQRLAALVGRPAPPAPPPRRRWTLAALAFLFLVLGAGWPTAAFILFVLTVVSVRFADTVQRRLHQQRARGPRRGNLVRQTVLSPWLLVITTVRSLAGLLVAALAGAGFAAAGLALLPKLGVGIAPGDPGKNVVLVLAAGLTLAIAWWGPSGAALQESTDRVLHQICPTSTATVVLTTATVLAALLLSVLVLAFPAVVWWPL